MAHSYMYFQYAQLLQAHAFLYCITVKITRLLSWNCICCSVFSPPNAMEEEEEVDDALAEETRALLDPDFVSQEIGDILDYAEFAEDDPETEETPCLPTHRRCAAHTLNLVAGAADNVVASVGSGKTSGSRYPRHLSKALGKLQRVWNRQRRSTLVSILSNIHYLSVLGVEHFSYVCAKLAYML